MSRLFSADRPASPRVRRASFVLLSGAMLGLSYPPFPFAPLAWFAFVPLLLLWLNQEAVRAAFIDAYGAFLTAFVVAFQWPLFHVDAQTALLSIPGVIVIPMWMAMPFGVAHLLRRRIGTAASLCGLATLFVLMEWGLRRGPFAFPWSLLGHSQAGLAPVNGLARFGGVPLLTAYVLILNLLALSMLSRLPRLQLLLGALALAGTLTAVMPGDVDAPDDRPTTAWRIGMVQPAISADEWADLEDPRRVDVLLALSDTLAAVAISDTSDLDLLVWPETALPPGDVAARRRVRRWVDAHGVPILTGMIEEMPNAYYNAALLVRPGAPDAVYRKRRLVPFAERVPLQSRWAWVRRLAVPSGGVPGYAAGATDDPLEIQSGRFGVLICFETLFDDAARAYVRRGADLIVAITQDGWWGDSFGYRQHLAFNRLRAIETGLPFVQVSVSGFSAVLDPDGAIRGRIGWMERRAAVAVVRTRHTETFVMRTGDWVSPLALVVSLGLVFVAFAYPRS